MPQPTLHTARLRLVPLADEHLDLEIALDSDAEVLRYVWGRARTRDEVIASHAKRMARAHEVDGLGFWTAFDTGGGFAGLMMLPPGAKPGEAELGYRLHRAFWGRGLASEASLALLHHAFTTVGLTRVYAEAMAVHEGSRRVMAKIGMRYVRTFHLDPDDPLPDTPEGEVEYETTREMWNALPRETP